MNLSLELSAFHNKVCVFSEWVCFRLIRRLRFCRFNRIYQIMAGFAIINVSVMNEAILIRLMLFYRSTCKYLILMNRMDVLWTSVHRLIINLFIKFEIYWKNWRIFVFETRQSVLIWMMFTNLIFYLWIWMILYTLKCLCNFDLWLKRSVKIDLKLITLTLWNQFEIYINI